MAELETALDRQRDQEVLAGTDEDAVLAHIHATLVNLHTTLPGNVTAYNSATHTCSAQPGIKRIFVKDGARALPVCLDVPVVFPGGALTFDITPGDGCLLFFAERCIDRWFSDGGVQEPDEFRMHDLSDGFALVGIDCLAKLLAEVGTGTELRTRDGSNRVALRDGMVLLGSASAGGSELTLVNNGVVLADAIDTLTELPRFVLGGTSMTVLAKP